MYQTRNQTRIRGGYNGFAAGNAAPQQPQQMFPQAKMEQPANNFEPPAAHPPATTFAPPTSNYSAPVPPPPPEYPPDDGYCGEEMDQGPSYAGQICKIGGKDKFLSFHNELNLAARPGEHEDDYAALHGSGGSKHAVRSRIEARMCDYSKGTGEKSINVKYNLEPYYLLYLLECVKAALHGNLHPIGEASSDAIRARAYAMVGGWIQERRPPTYEELVELHNLLAFDPTKLWSDFKEKNNPYPQACKMLEDIETKKTVEHTLVSTFQVQYNPSRNYQWTITISNFWAPTSRQSKGTCSHNSKRARDGQKVSIMVTTADLYMKLTNVDHFITTWERRAYAMLNAMCVKKEQDAEAWRQQQKNK